MKKLHLISLYATLKLETISHQSCRDDEIGGILALVGAAVHDGAYLFADRRRAP